jgi:hypothetical protein
LQTLGEFIDFHRLLSLCLLPIVRK